jgi:molybdopterin converting factor small subunit
LRGFGGQARRHSFDCRAARIMYVEFLGIPRERAGVSEMELQAETFGQVLGEISARCPGLSELVTPEGLHPSIAANLNGDAFVKSLETRLAENDRLLILSADAGG